MQTMLASLKPCGWESQFAQHAREHLDTKRLQHAPCVGLAVLFSPLGRVLSTAASELLDAATSVSFAGQRPRGILEAESLSAGFSAARPSECGARGTMSPRARRDCYVRSAANAPCFVCQNARSADGCLCGATWVCDREGPRARPEGNLVLPAS
jgi:hypothetical protein